VSKGHPSFQCSDIHQIHSKCDAPEGGHAIYLCHVGPAGTPMANKKDYGVDVWPVSLRPGP